MPLRAFAKDVINKRKIFLERGDDALEEVHHNTMRAMKFAGMLSMKLQGRGQRSTAIEHEVSPAEYMEPTSIGSRKRFNKRAKL